MSESLKEIRICFVGESFINGTGDPECLGWTGRVCAHANRKGYEITYYNLGVRGETSRYLKQRWQSEVFYRLPKEYDCRVIFSFGVNDTGRNGIEQGIELAESLENTRSILSEAKQHYPILMVGPPPCGDVNQEKRNQIVANLSQEFALVCNEHSPAKTVVDCFKFRNKIGLDVALEALRECLGKKRCTVDELWQYAKICRMQNVMRPYLEVLG